MDATAQYLRETSDDNNSKHKVCKGVVDRQIYLYKIDAVVTTRHNPAPRPNDIVAFNWRNAFATGGMAQGS